MIGGSTLASSGAGSGNAAKYSIAAGADGSSFSRPGGIAGNVGVGRTRQNRRAAPAPLASSSDKRSRSYPGGKAAAGTYQQIINLMPPHRVYIEPFVGAGSIMRLKRPAELNWGIDLSQAALDRCRSTIVAGGGARGTFRFLQEDGIGFLRRYAFGELGNELVYCGPPYLMSTRSSGRKVYEFEFSEAQHEELLDVVVKLPALVIISGYWSKLYAERLKGWHTKRFQAMTRGGRQATEWLWFNFPEPAELHDYRFLGCGFRERERIKRRQQRWLERLQRMPLIERRALMSALASIAVEGER